MDETYKRACCAYLKQYINEEVSSSRGVLYGWYDYIDSPKYTIVGTVVTSQILIMIKDCNLKPDFDCEEIVQSIIKLQNEDGGWSYRANISLSATEPTALAILAILLWCPNLDDAQRLSVSNGLKWIIKNRNEDHLWSPLGEKCDGSYIYFSAVVLRVLSRVNSLIGFRSICSDALEVYNNGLSALMNCFNNNDFQCGWGGIKGENPTVFHTAYVIDSLLAIDSKMAESHCIIKSRSVLLSYYQNMSNRYSIGERELFEHDGRRVNYTHSVDIYLAFALLRLGELSALGNSCASFINLAESTDFRYGGFVTGWRLYDVVSLCSYYNGTIGREHGVMHNFEVALTFAGETREFVEQVADKLSKKLGKEKVLYDLYYEAEFARPNLDVYLQDLYHNHTKLIVVFLCEQYATKKWCGVEWRAIRDILNHFDYDKIMYVKIGQENIDIIKLPGFYGLQDGYIDANTHTPQEIADLIIRRL